MFIFIVSFKQNEICLARYAKIIDLFIFIKLKRSHIAFIKVSLSFILYFNKNIFQFIINMKFDSFAMSEKWERNVLYRVFWLIYDKIYEWHITW